MTLLTEKRAAFVALEAPYVEPTATPVIGLSLKQPGDYLFTTTEFKRIGINDLIKAYAMPPDSPLRSIPLPAKYQPKQQDIIHIPFLDAD